MRETKRHTRGPDSVAARLGLKRTNPGKMKRLGLAAERSDGCTRAVGADSYETVNPQNGFFDFLTPCQLRAPSAVLSAANRLACPLLFWAWHDSQFEDDEKIG